MGFPMCKLQEFRQSKDSLSTCRYILERTTLPDAAFQVCTGSKTCTVPLGAYRARNASLLNRLH